MAQKGAKMTPKEAHPRAKGTQNVTKIRFLDFSKSVVFLVFFFNKNHILGVRVESFGAPCGISYRTFGIKSLMLSNFDAHTCMVAAMSCI